MQGRKKLYPLSSFRLSKNQIDKDRIKRKRPNLITNLISLEIHESEASQIRTSKRETEKVGI